MQISRLLKSKPHSPSLLQIDDSSLTKFEVTKTDDGRLILSCTDKMHIWTVALDKKEQLQLVSKLQFVS
jgi:hypothetical protein